MYGLTACFADRLIYAKIRAKIQDKIYLPFRSCVKIIGPYLPNPRDALRSL